MESIPETNTKSNNRKKCYVLLATVVLFLTGGGILLWYFLKRNHVDGCISIADKRVLDFKDVMGCYRSFPFDKQKATNTYDFIQNYFALSSIKDYLKNNKYPKNNKSIDVDEDLKKIFEKDYSDEFDYHNDLTKYFKTLQEGHTEYESLGFNTFKFELPFSLIPYYENGQVQLKVINYNPDSRLSEEWNKRGIKISSFINDIVLEIEGEPALQYIKEFADEFVGASRDPNYRVRSALARVKKYSSPRLTYGEFTKLEYVPNKAEISMTFKSNGKIVVPYLSLNVGGFRDSKTYYNKYIDTNGTHPKYINNHSTNENIKRVPSIFSGRFIEIFLVKDAAVMSISSFASENTIGEWRYELTNALKALRRTGIEKLVFDMSNNEGGLIAAAYELLEFFFPLARTHIFRNYISNDPQMKEFVGVLKKRMDSFKKPFVKKFYKKLINSYENYSNSGKPRIPYEINWIDERVLPDNMMTDTPPIPLSSIALISNGVCASACALFSNWIQEMTEITTYHIGNILNQSVTIGSCIGGSLYPILDHSINTSELDLSEINIGARTRFRISLIGFYSLKNHDESLDFTWLPTKKMINTTYEDHFNPIRVWTEVVNNIV